MQQKECQCSDEDIDEMVLCMDNFNAPVHEYHDIACRHPNLPRLNQVNNRKIKKISMQPWATLGKQVVEMKVFGSR